MSFIFIHSDKRHVRRNDSDQIHCGFCYPNQAEILKKRPSVSDCFVFPGIFLAEIGNPTYVGHTGNFVLEEAHTFLKTFHWVNRHGQTLFKLYFFYM